MPASRLQDLDATGVTLAFPTIPVAPTLGSLADNDVSDWVDREGLVICLPSGQRYKVKCPWYVAMAQAAKAGGATGFLPKVLATQPLRSVPAEKVWCTAIADIDDVVAACVTALVRQPAGITPTAGADDDDNDGAELNVGGDDAGCFLRFVSDQRAGFEQLVEAFIAWAQACFCIANDSAVVQAHAHSKSGWPTELTRAALSGDGERTVRLMKAMLLQHAKACRFAVLEQLLGCS